MLMYHILQRHFTPTTKRIVGAGLSSSFALSFFSSASQPKVDVDESKPKNFDIIVREADALYDSYLIDNAYSILKRYAILLDYIGEIEGNKSRLLKSYEVKEHLERALQICSSDATTWHILGVWHFSFADMGYATRLVAKAVFATPPSSTYEQALHYFLKAEEISVSLIE
ncbi:hypothetical protein COOONC_14613 [Cooperia oncophora]